MRPISRCSAFAALLLATALGAQTPQRAVVSGFVRNSATGDPISTAVIRAGAISTITNEDGRYRIELPLGEARFDVRKIGYRPKVTTADVVAGGTILDIRLDPIAVTLNRVVVTAEDEFARRLVAAAIERKKQLHGSLHDYRYRGDVRLIVRDMNKPADSTTSVRGITESRTEAYWEQPNKYQETILYRRQTDNVGADRNYLTVGNILDVSSDRILFARFELPSPIADDALDQYDYRVLDTLTVAGRRTYRLSVDPKPKGAPAFVGMMDIVDSTFDVVGIDVGVNSEVRLARAKDVRYRQHFRELAGGRWMPDSIELSALIDLGFIARIGIQHLALLSDFRFNEGQRPSGLGEYRVVVAKTADKGDSTVWANTRLAPLATLDSAAWKRIDSVANVPVPPAQRAVGLLSTYGLFGGRDFFHFNRVDGSYVGAGWTWFDPDVMPGTTPTAKLGYATGSKTWQYRVGDRFQLSEDRRMSVGALYYDETVPRPTLTSFGYNPTLRALISRADPLDYYRERAFVASFSTKLVAHTDADVGFIDAHQSSVSTVITRPPIRFSNDVLLNVRQNHAIDDGHLSAFTGGITYDSRPLLKREGRDIRLGATNFVRIAVTGEWAPSALPGDFDYGRVGLRLDRRQESFGWGYTTFVAAGGIGTSKLPIQRAYTVDGGAQVLEGAASPFSTLVDSNFTGSRTGLVFVQHSFDRLLFTRSRLPLVRDLPFTLTARAAVFWAEFPASGLDSAFAARRSTLNVTRAPYSEVGFTVGNLTPFLSIFNFSARFAWQLSHYDTSRFRVSIGLGG